MSSWYDPSSAVVTCCPPDSDATVAPATGAPSTSVTTPVTPANAASLAYPTALSISVDAASVQCSAGSPHDDRACSEASRTWALPTVRGSKPTPSPDLSKSSVTTSATDVPDQPVYAE